MRTERFLQRLSFSLGPRLDVVLPILRRDLGRLLGTEVGVCRYLQQHRLPEPVVPLMILLALVEGSRGAMRLVGKMLFVCGLTSVLAVPDIGGSARGGESQLEPLAAGTFHRRHIGRLYGPKSHYARAVQTGVYDSCWRRRVIAGPWGPEVCLSGFAAITCACGPLTWILRIPTIADRDSN
jgi:hypothetical protein